jgi:catechol 2,3-dioxygenase-like lactoylglutathione lyase family enzyme
VALHVRDLDASVLFFTNIFGFDLIPRPAFDFEGAWLSIDRNIQLHLLKFDNAVISHSRLCHFAFNTDDDLEIYIEKCQRFGYDYKPIKRRPDGKRQLFIIEPNGWYIEINQNE